MAITFVIENLCDLCLEDSMVVEMPVFEYAEHRKVLSDFFQFAVKGLNKSERIQMRESLTDGLNGYSNLLL